MVYTPVNEQTNEALKFYLDALINSSHKQIIY